ncbi:MAG: GH32 C-terminal domain-containing protein [Muribaculaceae bacterium]|nr:GH32 C-terminal domain-containing protein [Muribaculaceae bacterium]
MKQIINRCVVSALLVGGIIMPSVAVGAEGVEINHLGPTNTLVRVKGGDNYLLLPVQEHFEDDAKINVLVDGKLEETIYVRLARTKTDYTVPYDLSRFKDKNVVLDIVTGQSRNSVRDAADDVCWDEMIITDTFDTTNKETKWRPAYHHTPLYGWMNDPNGMFYKDGVWHLYYQKNPYGSKWQNMTWGHSTSTDLITWEAQPDAIRPDGLGAIFSGSAVIDHNNTAGYGEDAIIALFTSAGTSQMQSFAHSNDNGQTFEIYEGNPIITLDTEARDPNMFWNEKTGEWNLVLAHALEKENLFFTSPDLKTWTLSGTFGKGLGAQEGVWECPDLFELQIPGTGKTKWVLICNINPGGPFGGSAIQYFIGDFDGKTFTSDTNPDGTVTTKWLDYGKDNYALVSWSDAPDNRRTTVGWMSNWQYAADVPTMQFRSANTVPREMELFVDDEGELYVASVPSPELLKLRDKVVDKASNKTIGEKETSYKLPADGICEIDLSFQATESDVVTFTISNPEGEKVLMKYDAKNHRMSFDRRESGVVDFSTKFPAVTSSPTFEKDGKINLRLFIDRSSMELFGNNGEFVMTNLVFPNAPYTTLSMESKNGDARLDDLKVYSIKL